MKKKLILICSITMLFLLHIVTVHADNKPILDVIKENDFIKGDKTIYDTELYDESLLKYDLSNAVFIKVCKGFGMSYSEAFDKGNMDEIFERFKNNEVDYYIAVVDDHVIKVQYKSVKDNGILYNRLVAIDYSDNTPLWIRDILNSEIYNSKLYPYEECEAVYCVDSQRSQRIFYVNNGDVVMLYYEGENRVELKIEDYYLYENERQKYIQRLFEDSGGRSGYGYFGLTDFLRMYSPEEIKASQPKDETSETQSNSDMVSVTKTLSDSCIIYCGTAIAVTVTVSAIRKRKQYSEKGDIVS